MQRGSQEGPHEVVQNSSSVPQSVSRRRGGLAEDAPAATAQARALAESLNQVQAQVRQLHDALREVQAEAVRSRQEISELRRELQAARTPLTADRGARAPAAMPE